MNDLQEVIRLMSPRRVKKIEVLNNSMERNGNNYYYRLFDGFRTGKYKSDEDASRDLYNLPPDNLNYKTLKARFRERLLNSLLFIDPESFGNTNSFFTNYHKCNKQLIQLK